MGAYPAIAAVAGDIADPGLDVRFRFGMTVVLDGQDDPYADEVWGGPNDQLSLTQARENYLRIGARDEEWLRYVRPTLPEEM